MKERIFTDLMEEMIDCPSGKFLMGTEIEKSSDYIYIYDVEDDLEFQHEVTLSKDFKISKYLITQEKFETIMGYNPSKVGNGPNYPVDNVNWFEAKGFCDALNSLFKEKLPAGYIFDLPTEAQWEYACRAGISTDFNNGSNYNEHDSSCFLLHEIAWYDDTQFLIDPVSKAAPDLLNISVNDSHVFFEDSQDYRFKIKKVTWVDCGCKLTFPFGTIPVGQKEPNNWGLYDMHGNLSEWCLDWFADYPKIKRMIDPQGPQYGEQRVIRGGSWHDTPLSCRSASRNGLKPITKNNIIGFRVILKPVC